MKERQITKPSTIESILVIGVLFAFITICCIVFKLKADFVLIMAAVFAALAARRHGLRWKDIEEAITDKMKRTIPTILIIFTTGIVIGSLMYSGSIPMLIYYGMKVINPKFLLVSAFILCCIVSTMTGSSWTSAGTAGVAMMGVAQGLGVPLGMTAGAVIAGSLFGDKMSPLSDSTNMAPLCAGTNIFSHIKAMFWTTVPAAVIALIIYFIGGMQYGGDAEMPQLAANIMDTLSSMYEWNILLLLPFIIILACAIKKQDPVPSLLSAGLVALILGLFIQGFSIQDAFNSAITGFRTTMITSEEIMHEVAYLLDRGGMQSMNSIICIIFAGYAYAAILSKVGYLEIALQPVIKKINSDGKLICFTILSSAVVYCCAASAYVVYILIAEIFRGSYIKRGIKLNVLSRCLEDFATCSNPLVPWGSGAMYYMATLGVTAYGAGGYAFWTTTTYLTPIISILIGFLGLGIYRMSKEEQAEELEKWKAENAIE